VSAEYLNFLFPEFPFLPNCHVSMFQSYDDKGPVIDAVVWHDGEVWRVALDTQSLEDDPDCGKLADSVPLTNYRYVQSLVIVACLHVFKYLL